MAADTAHPLLSGMHFTLYAAIMPLHPYLFGVCAAGHYETWSLEGPLPGGVACVKV